MQRQTYQNLKRNAAQFQSTMGLSLSCFDELFLYFEVQWDKYHREYTIGGNERIPPPRIYKNKVFEDIQSMLVFILYYLKNNCLQEAQAAMFGMSQPQANLWIHLLKNILLKSLKASTSLPCRDFESLQKFLELGQDIFLDGSERPIPRPSDDEVQKECYSGKKTHTVKNIFLTSMTNRVLYLSPTYEGTAHDKSTCDEEQIKFDVPVILWEDLGFVGLNPDNADVRRPIKKPRKKELDDQQKAFNRKISSKRLKVEHTIGQCKVFRIVKDEVRAFKDDFRDTCILLACALNNFKMNFIKT
jgi:hypothetical protein